MPNESPFRIHIAPGRSQNSYFRSDTSIDVRNLILPIAIGVAPLDLPADTRNTLAGALKFEYRLQSLT